MYVRRIHNKLSYRKDDGAMCMGAGALKIFGSP